MIRARDIMSRDIVSASPETDIKDVLQLMADCQISGVPIEDNNRHVIGMVTEYDLLRAITYHRLTGKAIDYIGTDVITIPDDASLSEINEVLIRERIRRLPVTRHGRLVGVVSRRDVVHSENYREQLPILWPKHAVDARTETVS